MAALRIVAGRPGHAVHDAGRVMGPTLEVTHRGADSPARVEAAARIEEPFDRRAIPPSGEEGFAAFLDGIQRTRVLTHVRGVIPVVYATVAAAIRQRIDRTMHTWGSGPRLERLILVPVAMLDPSIILALEAAGFAVVDTAPGPEQSGHPQQLLAAARLVVQQRRESVEGELAAAWRSAGGGLLYVDGGIGGLPEPLHHADVVGVVKSHRTLYGDARVAQSIAALSPGERSSACGVSTRRRTAVASWYLRLHDGAGDPLGGVVRIEVAESTFTPQRADVISSWILREREPVSLPDARWRVMAYGIRDCEEYLRAVTA